MKRGMLLIIIIGLGIVILAVLTSCVPSLKSYREVENHLQELYGIPFEVIDAQRISDEHLQEGVWAAKVYEVIPQDDPDSPFWAYSIISGETGGVPGFQSGMLNTYGLDQIERILTDALEMAGFNVSVAYGTYPCKDMDEKYFSSLRMLIDVDQENLHLACETVSLALQEVIDETVLTGESITHALVSFRYREESWEADQHCTVDFSLFYWRNWSEEEGYFWGALDFSAEALEKTILHEVGFR